MLPTPDSRPHVRPIREQAPRRRDRAHRISVKVNSMKNDEPWLIEVAA
jgi:hypothetical protein